MTFNDALAKLGFTSCEATVFSTLIKNGASSGYEVAKLSGLSRSNVYAALYSLQEKGKCYLIDGETHKYIALSKEELLYELNHEYLTTLSIIDTLYPVVPISSEPYITIKGYENVLKKIRYTLSECQSHIYILSTQKILTFLARDIALLARTKKVTIITDELIHIDHTTLYIKPRALSGFNMIMDTSCVITGDLGTTNQCLYTHNHSLVRLMRESFITELDMIQLTQS